MRCRVARLCERTVGHRVPPLWAGGGLLHTTPHCVVVTALGAELATFGSHTRSGWFHRVRSCGVTESRTVPCGGGGSGRSTSAVGNGAELRALRSAGVGSLHVAGRSLALLEHQPQQASCRHDQHGYH